MTLRGDGTYDHLFHESSFGLRNTCADNPGEWGYGHPTAHLAGVIGGWRLRCLGGVLKGWGLWLRKFRAHDFQVNARGWRLGGLPCTIVAVHGSNSAPTFPFTFKTRGVWFEPPDKICAKDGEDFTPISQMLARIRARLDYPVQGPCATDASPVPFSHSPQLSSALVPRRHPWGNRGRRCKGPINR